MEYADISELDDKVQYLRVTWRKMINFASVFTREFQTIEKDFESGKYGPEWTFARWLGAKCGMSRSTCYRVIAELHKVASDEQRDRTKNALAEMRRDKALLEADRRATQKAWDAWLDEKKLFDKHSAKIVQDAWDQYRLEEKDRIAVTQAAWDQYQIEEKVRLNAEKAETDKAQHERELKDRKNKRERAKRAEGKKDKKTKQIDGTPRLDPKSAPPIEKPVSNVRLEDAIDRLVALLGQLPDADRAVVVKRIVIRLNNLLGEGENVISFPAGTAQS